MLGPCAFFALHKEKRREEVELELSSNVGTNIK